MELNVLDAQFKVQVLACALVISSGLVHNIFNQQLNMEELSAKWVPWLCTTDQKRNLVKYSKDGCTRKFKSFLQSEVITTGFWHCYGIICYDYLGKCKIIKGAHHVMVLNHFKPKLRYQLSRMAHKNPSSITITY